ncbi:MAG: exo-alpha-sialidase [bacterium]|nr:exo-alpha-sialidase [bacterium]
MPWKSRLFHLSLCLFCCLWLCTPLPLHAEEQSVQLKLLSVQKIWDQGNHNAFTDLVWYKDRFFCVFREGAGHVSPEGTIRVLSSRDGKQWGSTALLSLAGYDLRDPKISVDPIQDRLMILGGAAKREGTQTATEHRSFLTFSADGSTWESLTWIAAQNQWLWRLTWHDSKAWGVAYDCGLQDRNAKSYGTRLYCSGDGREYIEWVAPLFEEHGPTEATLRFAADGTAYCLQRRDGKENNTALLGTSQPPYQEWQWKDLGIYYGGPEFMAIPGSRWLAVGRVFTPEGARTQVCALDVEQGQLHPLLTLPSGGDTSYPGMVWRDGKVWISYYASHEGKTSIYIAEIEVVE